MKTIKPVLLMLSTGFLCISCMNEKVHKENKLMELFNQGNTYYEQGNYQEAYDCLTKCIEMDSTYVEFYENRGNMSSFMRDLKSAKKDYEKALSMDTCSSSALQGLAEYYDANKKHEKAVHYWERLIWCDSIDPFSYINYGISCYEVEDYNNALLLFFKCLKYAKEIPTPYKYIGDVFNLQGDSVSGEKFLKTYEELSKKLRWDSVKHITVIR